MNPHAAHTAHAGGHVTKRAWDHGSEQTSSANARSSRTFEPCRNSGNDDASTQERPRARARREPQRGTRRAPVVCAVRARDSSRCARAIASARRRFDKRRDGDGARERTRMTCFARCMEHRAGPGATRRKAREWPHRTPPRPSLDLVDIMHLMRLSRQGRGWRSSAAQAARNGPYASSPSASTTSFEGSLLATHHNWCAARVAPT